MDGFNKMTGVLLKQYTSVDDMKSDFLSPEKLDGDTAKLVLDRIGEEIEEQYKKRIMELISNNKIYEEDYRYLFNLIRKLISNYDAQKKYDDRVKNFVNTCNKYLNGKHFYYNPSALTLEILLDEQIGEEKKTIKLTQLSSGEKQIVSLFSKLYLEGDDNSIVIIDEPELSLSIKWQAMLLPDIMRSNNCRLLLTVTHSPFVFENEFDYDAREMRQFIKLHR